MNEKIMNAMILLAAGEKDICCDPHGSTINQTIEKAMIAAEVLTVLETNHQPMRVKEILSLLTFDITSQKLTYLLQLLTYAGTVQRIETDEKEFIPFGEDLEKMVPIIKFTLT